MITFEVPSKYKIDTRNFEDDAKLFIIKKSVIMTIENAEYNGTVKDYDIDTIYDEEVIVRCRKTSFIPMPMETRIVNPKNVIVGVMKEDIFLK